MKLPFLLAAVATAALSTAADAQVRFTISGGFDASFELPTSPTPDFADDGYLFAITGVRGFGTSATGVADLSFFNGGATGGLLISDPATLNFLFDANGVQLYTGSENAPIFRTGTFRLTGLSTPGDFVVTIASVPEPASWAMMIGGFALAGGAMRYRRRTVTARLHD